jgi:lipid-A-disaccharide synthase
LPQALSTCKNQSLIMSSPVHRHTILFIAGDLSGNANTTRLAECLVARHQGMVVHALGGAALGAVAKKSGGTWIADTTNCSAIGITSVLLIYARAKWMSLRMQQFVRKHPVDAVVLCDWGGFNCRQLKFFNTMGIPILYFFPPRSWQQSGNAGLAFAPQVTRVATPFPWSAERLNAAGCRADWVGHPLLETAMAPSRRNVLRAEFGVQLGETLVALLPGSRRSEVRVLGPRMVKAAAILTKDSPVKFLVPVPEPLLEMAHKVFPPSFQILAARSTDALLAADAAIVKMGSATLEAAVLGAPQVAVYDFGWATRFEWALLWAWKKIPFVAMPNIILQRELVPELLGMNCRPEAMARVLKGLLKNDVAMQEMQKGYQEIRRQLGSELPHGATLATARILEEMLEGRVGTKTLQHTSHPFLESPDGSSGLAQ